MTIEQIDAAYEYFKPIIFKEDGTLNEDKLKLELASFYFLAVQIRQVYKEMLGLDAVDYPSSFIIAMLRDRYVEKE